MTTSESRAGRSAQSASGAYTHPQLGFGLTRLDLDAPCTLPFASGNWQRA
jgi:hypothetical protein